MRGVGRSGHSRGLQIFVRQAGGYANTASTLQNVLRERATENDTTVDLPCPQSRVAKLRGQQGTTNILA